MLDCAGSLQVEALRVARLAPNGEPLAGAGNLYVTDSLVSLGVDPEVSEGDDHELKNGRGVPCVSKKDPDTLKRLNLTLVLCTPDAWLHNFLAGGEVINDGADVIGWAAPEVGEDPTPDGVSFEAWTKAIVEGHQADDRPWIRWVFPRTKWRFGARNMANEIMQVPFPGFAEQNGNWGNGPANDWDHISTRLVQYARDDDVPAAQCGPSVLVVS